MRNDSCVFVLQYRVPKGQKIHDLFKFGANDVALYNRKCDEAIFQRRHFDNQ